MAEWLKCAECRQSIAFGKLHWECSVSTCNRNRNKLVFCSVACWDAHLSTYRHREAWAVEATAPSQAVWQAQSATASQPPTPTPSPAGGEAPTRRVVATPAAAPSPGGPTLATQVEAEVLIVVSKMKKYIRERSGMNCSDAVAEQLSDWVRVWCDDAIGRAHAEGRKTVLDRDVPKPRG